MVYSKARRRRFLAIATRRRNYYRFRVCGFRLYQDRNIGIGVFPGREEILIRGARAFAAAQHADRRVPHHAETVDVFLKLRRKPQVASLSYRQFTTTSMG